MGRSIVLLHKLVQARGAQRFFIGWGNDLGKCPNGPSPNAGRHWVTRTRSLNSAWTDRYPIYRRLPQPSAARPATHGTRRQSQLPGLVAAGSKEHERYREAQEIWP